MKTLGYARVSTGDQTTALQRDALKEARCVRVYEDKGISGVARRRPALERALAALDAGDLLIVWRLDRLGRNLSDLLRIAERIAEKGAHLRSLTDGIDTTSTGGKLIFHVMGALAEFERNLIVERTQAGIQAARKRGQRFGRPPRLTPGQVDHALKLVEAGESVKAVARSYGVDKTTLYRAFQRREREQGAA